ncbi:hypothetical protein GYMLUDRAFT_37809 [Collybiopsis luxurians FD-317 M1]|nr:hypothetical protein GYMLUDRAFT_37809 [Collybiopsis luxurians FD-317 M1]
MYENYVPQTFEKNISSSSTLQRTVPQSFPQTFFMHFHSHHTATFSVYLIGMTVGMHPGNRQLL